MEQSNNQFMGFKEEDSFRRSWAKKNINKAVNLLEPVWWGNIAIEKEILPILDKVDFYALYVEQGSNSGTRNVFLIAHNGSDWVQFCWENGHRIALEKPVLDDKWNKKICNLQFSDDIVVDTGESVVFDAISVYLFITCHNKLKRFSVYHPDYSGIDSKSDDRYILQIQRMIENIGRDHQRIQSAKK